MTTEEKQQLRNGLERHRRKNPDYDQITSSMFPGGIDAVIDILDLDPSSPEQIRQVPKDKLTVEQTAKIRAFYKLRYATVLLDSGEKVRQAEEREARHKMAQDEETPTGTVQVEPDVDENEPDWENIDQVDAEELARAEELAKARLEALDA